MPHLTHIKYSVRRLAVRLSEKEEAPNGIKQVP